MTIEELARKKVLFVTGKGGVGKSTTTSALAYHLAEQGQKVLVIDADPAHSLPDTFGITEKVYGQSKKFSSNGKLVKVREHLSLDLLLLNPVTSKSHYTGPHRIMWLAELGKEIGFYSNLGRMAEFFTLADALYRHFGKYDRFVIDNEPSAGTLDMVDSIEGWLNGLENVNKYKPLFSLMLSSGIINKEIAQQTKDLLYSQNGYFVEENKRMLKAVKNIFTDAKYLEPIIISSPEDAVVRETHRLREELEDRLGIANKYVIFNKVMIDDPEIKRHQESKIKLFEEKSKTKCFVIPYLDPKEVNLEDEVSAAKSLERIALLLTPFENTYPRSQIET